MFIAAVGVMLLPPFNLKILSFSEERKMRRFLSLALVLVLCLSMAACGKKTEDSLSDGVLTVAMECAYAPYNWTQPTDANGAVKIKDSNDYAYGYDVMMAKKIAAALNAELEIVKLDWDSLVPAVQSGVVDCVIAGQSITCLLYTSKALMPRYNILLKDDKHFPYVRLDTKQDFPRFEVVRRVKKDGAKYFGPYLSSLSLKDALTAIRDVYKRQVKVCARGGKCAHTSWNR